MNNRFIKTVSPFAGLMIAICIFLLANIHTKASGGRIDTLRIDGVIPISETNLTGADDTNKEIPEEHNIYVYTPEGYSTSAEFTTFYILEGLYSVDNQALDTPYQTILDEMIREKDITRMIVVVIPESVYSYTNFNDIVTLVDSLYSTKKESSGRIISGFSNGAYYIWWNILTKPNLVKLADTYIPMSPIGCSTIFSGEEIFPQIKAYSERIRIYNTCGDTGCEEDYRGRYGGKEQMELIIENGRRYGFTEGYNIFQYQAAGEHNWDQAWDALKVVLPKAINEINRKKNVRILF